MINATMRRLKLVVTPVTFEPPQSAWSLVRIPSDLAKVIGVKPRTFTEDTEASTRLPLFFWIRPPVWTGRVALQPARAIMAAMERNAIFFILFVSGKIVVGVLFGAVAGDFDGLADADEQPSLLRQSGHASDVSTCTLLLEACGRLFADGNSHRGEVEEVEGRSRGSNALAGILLDDATRLDGESGCAAGQRERGQDGKDECLLHCDPYVGLYGSKRRGR